MEHERRSIVVFLLALGIFTLALAGGAQAESGPTGSYIVTTEVPTAQLLLNVDKRNTLIFTSSTDFGVIAGRQASPSLGTWSRRGNDTLDFVAYSFLLSAAGLLTDIQRISGTGVTTDRFATADLDILVEFFDPTQDVLDPAEVPRGSFTIDAHARRIPKPDGTETNLN